MSTYSDLCQSHLDKALDTLLDRFPEQHAKLKAYNEVTNYTYDAAGRRVTQPMELGILCQSDEKYRGRYAVTFRLKTGKNGTPLIAFTLDLYPECCALHQLNGFYHAGKAYLEENFFRAFVHECITAYAVSVNTPSRFMINFVEAGHYGDSPTEPPEDSPNILMNYPMWYEWAKQFQMQYQRFVNHNTMRVIRNVVVNYRG